MALNQWSRRSFVLVAPILAITGLRIGSSLGQEGEDDETDGSKVEATQAAKTLTITITAAENGQMSSLTVGLAKLFGGPATPAHLRQLDRRLKDAFAVEAAAERVLLRVDERLNSGDLIRVINVCDRQRIADGGQVKKINFVVLAKN
jgi:hypothetical protein